MWTSRDGTYAAYDSSHNLLYFPDGTFWAMTVQSAAGEADAGTLYPSSVQDSNGNYIQLQYGPGVGTTVANTSGRITHFMDARGYNVNISFTYSYLNSADPFPHLTRIDSLYASGENYTFSYASNLALSSPFTMAPFGSATVLQAVTVINQQVSYPNVSYNLLYALGTGELTQVSLPTGGTLAWGYRTYTYAGSGLSYREVQTRQMSPSAGVTYSWNIALDNNPTLHASATVSDLGANASKVWTFGPSITTLSAMDSASGSPRLRRRRRCPSR